jgi:hypothetical protein
MNNLKISLNLILVLFLFISCSEKIDEPQKELSCIQAGKVVKTATNARGMIMKMEREGRTIWYILSMEGVIGQNTPTYDTRDLVIPCNLEIEFKKENQLVKFSGDLALYGQEFNEISHIYLGEISDIEFIEK